MSYNSALKLKGVFDLFKKSLSIIMTACMIMLSLCVCSSATESKQALPLSAGIEALRGQFELDTAEECNGCALDYAYYSPVGENDSQKYPVVIYLHGIGHGSYTGSQAADSDMAYWASQELQSRWKDTGGAYILLPRSPEDELQYWNKSLVDPLRTLIDSFISKHGENVDSTRIFIGGSSAGGEMAWDMAITYPEYFAGIYPLAATGTRTAADIERTKDVAVWIFSSTLDPIVNFAMNVMPMWKTICQHNSHPENCRLSAFGTVVNPDGSKGDSNHRLYTTISHDFFMLDGSPYANVTTTDGNGNTVSFENSEGMIAWMSDIHSSFVPASTENRTDINALDYVLIFIRNIVFRIANLFQRLLGFV